MPTFSYTAKDKSGETVTGSVEADGISQAAGKIREMGCWPLDVTPESGGEDETTRTVGVSHPFRRGASLRSLAVFFRQLSTMLQAGMALSEALDTLGGQRGMGRLPGIAVLAAEHVRRGGMFSETMAQYPHVFTPIQI